jgi:alcohol dehydrogenase
MVFEFTSPTRLVFGEGAFARLGEVAAALGRRALLVTGSRALTVSGHVDRARELLAAAGVDSVVYSRIPPNPTAEAVDAGAAMARDAGCDLVVGLGGGSAMDAAKAIAVVAAHDLPARRFLEPDAEGNVAQPTASTLPVVCVTSTSGTSSELTPFAVVTVSDTREKRAIRSPAIQPRVAIEDPELTYSAPPNVTAATGVDVLCHALEAYVSATAQPLTDLLAAEAIRLVGEYLPRAVADGSDTEARRQMMLANAYAGYGLANCGVTIMHAMEHPVSGHYPQVAHGAGLATFLRPWVRLVGPREPAKLAHVTALLGCGPDGTVAAAESALDCLLQTVGMDLRLRDLGVADTSLETMAADTLRYMGLAAGRTPGGVTAADVLELYESAY